jgi:hypothetical protein
MWFKEDIWSHCKINWLEKERELWIDRLNLLAME